MEPLFQEHIQDYLHQNPSFSAEDKIQIKSMVMEHGWSEIQTLFFFPFQFYKLNSLLCLPKEKQQLQL